MQGISRSPKSKQARVETDHVLSSPNRFRDSATRTLAPARRSAGSRNLERKQTFFNNEQCAMKDRHCTVHIRNLFPQTFSAAGSRTARTTQGPPHSYDETYANSIFVCREQRGIQTVERTVFLSAAHHSLPQPWPILALGFQPLLEVYLRSASCSENAAYPAHGTLINP